MTDTTPASDGESTGAEEASPMTTDALLDRIEELEAEKAELESEVLDLQTELDQYEQRVHRLKQENENLKSGSLFVGTVQELTDDGVIVKQHGNNQEALTEVSDQLRDELEPDDRVALNNSLSIVTQLPPATDTRVQAMQVEHNPGIDFTDIGGLDEQIEEVREAVELPLTNPDRFDQIGVTPPSGVLLHGPPGTGKTLLAKAVAERTDATFIQMAGSELAQKFVGEGARLVRELFETARENDPAILFLDELDAIAAERGQTKGSGDAEIQRTLMQLLSELDGFDSRGDVRVIAATNRLDMLDEAILRPGRFDRIIEVPTPDLDGRKRIFDIHTQQMNTADGIDFTTLAASMESVTGAEIEAICTEAGMKALRDGRDVVTQDDFQAAYESVVDAPGDTDTASPVAFA